MTNITLGIQNVCVSILAATQEAQPLLDGVSRDFQGFKAEPNSSATIKIQLWCADKLPERAVVLRNGSPIVSTKTCDIFGWSGRRACDYGNVIALSNFEKDCRLFYIFATNSVASMELAREVCHSILLSSIGEQLDRSGYHRIHALAFSYHQKSFLLAGDSGVGKSSLALQLLRNSDASLFSDESPLVHKGMLYPFPSRLAIAPEVADSLELKCEDIFVRKLYKPKALFAFAKDRQAKPDVPSVLIAGLRSSAGPTIRKCTRMWIFFTLMRSLVVGVGVAQMAEWLLRVDSLLSLVGIAFSRCKQAITLCVRANGCYEFKTGADARANAIVLQEFLDSRSLPELMVGPSI